METRRLIYVDAFDGVSGDLLLGLVLALGAPRAAILRALRALGLPAALRVSRVTVRGISALRARIEADAPETERSYQAIRHLLERSSLSESVRRRSLAVLARLATNEARLHGVPLDRLHLHEVGGFDTVGEVVGVLQALEELAVEDVYVSSLPWSTGLAITAHGEIPLPAPAAVACLPRAVWHPTNRQEELVTPTGAAILGTLAKGFGPPPELVADRQAFAATERSLIRGVLGRPLHRRVQIFRVETAVDDLSPEAVPEVIQAVIEAGALDARVMPVSMKKGRVGFLFHALARPEHVAAVEEALVRASGSLGALSWPCSRFELPRVVERLWIDGQPVRVKRGPFSAKPEWEDVRMMATLWRVSAREAEARIRAHVSRETDPGRRTERPEHAMFHVKHVHPQPSSSPVSGRKSRNNRCN